VLVIVVGYLYVDRLSLKKGMVELESAVQEKPGADQPTIPNPEQYRAIAVLPFADMSEAGDQAWFAEGVAEELLHALAGVEELQVMARTSSFAFKDTDKTIAEIADILNVQAVLEGSVRRSGDRVRITAQLVDANNGYQIWSGAYERHLNDIFQLQDELAKSIVRALRVQLGVEPSGRLIAEQTGNIEAYNLFIRGRALYDWSNAENHLQSIEYFERSVEADPGYALAWGYLAIAQSLSVLWRSIDDVYPAARTAYERALMLEPGQSEALASKALMTIVQERDWKVAGMLYQRSLASKDNTVAMIGYGAFLLPAIDRLAESVRLYLEAEERDPLHAGIKANLAMFMLYSGDTDGSIQKAREALELEPGHLFGFMALIEAYTTNGQYSQAEATLEKVPPKLRQHLSIRAREGLYRAAVGDYQKAREIYRDIVNSSPAVPVAISCALALAVGEVEGAIDIMEVMVEKKAWSIPWIRTIYRHNEMLENHPRYLALLERIGLDDESVSELQEKLSL
jgi:adenylate cyclase